MVSIAMITSTPTHVHDTTLNSSVVSTATTDTRKASKVGNTVILSSVCLMVIDYVYIVGA